MIFSLPPDHRAAIQDPCTWADNPFIKREARRDRKRRQLPKTLLWMAVLMMVMGGGLFYGLDTALKQFHTVPWWLGGDPLLALFIIVSGLHIWFITFTAQRGTLLLFAQEANASTLMHLMMVPATRFQIVLQTAVYPWLSAMRIALLLLPFYVFMVALERVTWTELFCLYLFFAGTAVSFPVLRKPGVGDSAPTLPTQQPKLQNTTASAFSGTEAQNARANQNAQTGSGGWSMMAFFMPMTIAMFGFAMGRGAAGMHAILGPYFPDSILSLMPASMIAWPFLIARSMTTPFAWFGLHIWPIVFCVPLTVLQRYLSAVRTAEFLQVGTYRDLAGLPTYVMRRKAEAFYRSAVSIALIGYAWKWMVTNGSIILLPASKIRSSPGLPTFLYILMCLAGLTVLNRASEAVTWIRADHVRKTRLAQRAIKPLRILWYCCMPAIGAFGTFALCSVLSGLNPFRSDCVAVLVPMICMMAAGGLISFGVDAAMGTFSAIPRLLLMIASVGAWNSYHIEAARWLGLLSPTLGFASLSQYAQSGLKGFYGTFTWVHFASALLGLGVLLSTIGLLRLRALMGKEIEGGEDAILDPTIYGSEVFRDEAAIALDATAKEDTPLALAIIKVVQKSCDNAVAVKELRARLRGRMGSNGIRNLLVLMAVLTVGLFQLPAFPETIGGYFASALYGTIVNPGIQIISEITVCWYMVLVGICAFAGFGATRLFTVEREKSTLGFILLTPMTVGSIVRGKFSGFILATVASILVLFVWTFILSLCIIPGAGFLALLVWLAISAGSILLFCAVTSACLSFGALISKFTINPGVWRFSFAIGIQIFIQSLRFIIPWLNTFFIDLGITPRDGLIIFTSVSIATILLAYIASVWSIGRFRKGDLKFAESRKEN